MKWGKPGCGGIFLFILFVMIAYDNFFKEKEKTEFVPRKIESSSLYEGFHPEVTKQLPPDYHTERNKTIQIPRNHRHNSDKNEVITIELNDPEGLLDYMDVTYGD